MIFYCYKSSFYRFIFLFALLMLSACKKVGKEENISSGEFSAHISYWSQPLTNGGTTTVVNTRVWTLFGLNFYKPLGSEFYKEEINLNYNPGDFSEISSFIVLPHKKILVTNFYYNGGGTMIAGYVKRADKPHLLPLVGCLKVENTTFSRIGPKVGLECDRSNIFRISSGIFYKDLQTSIHDRFWIDYKTEDIYEIPYSTFGTDGAYPPDTLSFQSNTVNGVAGLDASRKQLLILYNTLDQSVYNLCAYRVLKTPLTTAYQCFTFQPSDTSPKFSLNNQPITSPVPVTSDIMFYDGGMVAQRFEWISRYFEFNPKSNKEPLVPKYGTKIILSGISIEVSDEM